MKATISMDKAGRLVLPKEFREQFGLGAGSQLDLVAVGDRLELSPSPSDVGVDVVQENGLMVFSVGDDSIDVAQGIAEMREYGARAFSPAVCE